MFVAIIATAADVVAGEHCDVSVVDMVDGVTREIVLDSIELPVRTDDTDKLARARVCAETMLTERGWSVASAWDVVDNAMYADAEHA